MFKNRLVIPACLRNRLLQVLHAAHQGVDGMTARASNSIYWPGMNASVRQKRESCDTCNKIAPSQAREPLKLLPSPDYPFQQLCMDAFELCGNHYLAAVDRFSNWLLVFHIRCDPRAKHIIQSLQSIFMTYGTPEKLFTDGGLPFQAQEVNKFLNDWQVEHVVSSASYPQGNGRAELAVKTAKRILRDNTARDGSLNTDKACRAFLQYRNTPVKHVGLSPAQILFHRNLRDGIPMDPAMLKPNQMWVIAASQRENDFFKRNQSLFKTYNHSSRSLAPLDVGTEVIMQDQSRHSKRWNRYGTIVHRDDRKYFIRVRGSGRIVTKNRKFVKKVANKGGTDPLSFPSDDNPDQVDQSSNTTIVPSNTQSSREPVDDASTAIANSAAEPGNNNNHSSRPQASTTTTAKIPRMLKELQPYNNRGLKE